jgi:hypothetical protein
VPGKSVWRRSARTWTRVAATARRRPVAPSAGRAEGDQTKSADSSTAVTADRGAACGPGAAAAPLSRARQSAVRADVLGAAPRAPLALGAVFVVGGPASWASYGGAVGVVSDLTPAPPRAERGSR